MTRAVDPADSQPASCPAGQFRNEGDRAVWIVAVTPALEFLLASPVKPGRIGVMLGTTMLLFPDQYYTDVDLFHLTDTGKTLAMSAGVTLVSLFTIGAE